MATPTRPVADGDQGLHRSARLALALAWATALYTCVLVYGTHHPRPERLIGTGAGVPSDKSLHVAAYTVLAALAAAWLWAAGRWTPRGLVGLIAALALFAAVDEITQPLFSRHADPLDWLADGRGMALGIGAIALTRLVLRLSSERST
jgi:hypothetical protein